MSTGAILLAMITFVVISDVLIALYFRRLADGGQSGATAPAGIDPANARKIATMLLLSAPVLWLVVALISFGVIPTGIDPIKF